MASVKAMRSAGFAVATVLMLVFAAGSAAEAATPGSTIWAARYDGPGNGSDVGCCMAMSPDGTTVFVTGRSDSGRGNGCIPIQGTTGSCDFATVAYDASSGARLWIARYDGPAHEDDHATSIAVSPDGSKVFVTGVTDAPATPSVDSSDYGTVAYQASTGHQLWIARYDGEKQLDEAASVAVNPAGTRVFVTGRSEDVVPCGTSTCLDMDYATVAYRASTGAQVWVARYKSGGDGYDAATALAVSPDGTSVFVTGLSGGPDGGNYATVAYDATTGTQRWRSVFNGVNGGVDQASSLAVGPDGSTVFVTGISYAGVFSYRHQLFDYATVAYSTATGGQRWVTRYNGPANGDDEATAIAVSPDGSTVFVTGRSANVQSSSNIDDYDYETVAYDVATGAQIWGARYHSADNSSQGATALATSPDGSVVFVTGGSADLLSETQASTIAYNARSGGQLWLRRFPHGGTALAAAVCVDPDGSKVFIAGTRNPESNNEDYATVAYAA